MWPSYILENIASAGPEMELYLAHSETGEHCEQSGVIKKIISTESEAKIIYGLLYQDQ